MGKIGKTIKGLIQIVKNPWLLNHVLEDDVVWKSYIKKHYNLDGSLKTVELTSLLPNFKEDLKIFSFLDGGSLPTDIALLKALAGTIENCSYFEIGTWRGESVVNVAENAKECYTLNLSSEDIQALGLSKKYAEQHAFFSKRKENITHLTGNSKDYDFAGLNKKFDLIFIDGDHHYEMVKNDTAKVFENLVHDNTIVVWHDYAYSPESYRPEVLAGILDGIPANLRQKVYHVSNTMCAIYNGKDLKSDILEYPTEPKHTFSVSLESKPI